MAAIDDLKSAVTDLTTQLGANNDAIATLIGKIQPGASEADIEAVVSQLQALTQANKDALAKIPA